MKKVYVITCKTGTILSHIIKWLTGEPYPHCSISLDKSLYRMYSFGRRTPYDVFNAGLVHERPDKNIFARFPKTTCCIYEIDVTNEQYVTIWNNIKEFWQHKEKYHFNHPGIVAAWVNLYPDIPDFYYCSQFVGCMLEKAGVKYSEKPFRQVRSVDFRESSVTRKIYEGNLLEYWNSVKRPED